MASKRQKGIIFKIGKNQFTFEKCIEKPSSHNSYPFRPAKEKIKKKQINLG